MAQLALPFIEPQLPTSAIVNNFFEIGFGPMMVPAVAYKHNNRQIRQFSKTKTAQLYMPLRSRPYQNQKVSVFGRNRSVSKSISLNRLMSFFRAKDLDEALFDKLTKLYVGKPDSTTTLDSIVIDVNVVNKITLTIFCSNRTLVQRIHLSREKIGRRVRRLPKIDMRQQKTQYNFIIQLSYDLNDEQQLELDTENSYVQTKYDKFFLTEKYKGSGIPILYNFFFTDRLGSFFTAQDIPISTQKSYIGAVGDLVLASLIRLFPESKKYSSPATFFDNLIFKQSIDSYLVRDLFPTPQSIRPWFKNTLSIQENSLTPFENPFSGLNIKDLLLKGFEAEDAGREKEFYPFCKWAVKKTMEFWTSQSKFFTEDGYMTFHNPYEVVDILQQVNMFYSMYYKLFSDKLTEVDEIYPKYFVRYMMYDFDIDHFRADDYYKVVNINKRTTYMRYIVEAYYNASACVGSLMSSAKMRRFFSDFFVPFDMSTTTYASLDGHMHDLMLSQYAWLSAFPQLWQNITTYPQIKDRYKDDVPWKDFASFSDLSTRLNNYTKRFKYLGKPRTNPLYDVFEKADLRVPGTNLILEFADNTGVVKLWGEEQSHCIGNYADYLNDPNKLLFGVRDRTTNKWFGHCWMDLTSAGRSAPKQDHYDTVPHDYWMTNQFRGYHNADLNGDQKRCVIEHLLRIMYPQKPDTEIAEEKGLEVGEKSVGLIREGELQHI